MSEHGMGRHAPNLAELCRRYYRFMEHRNLIDFPMMQAKVIKLIRSDADFCDKLAGMFDYVIVDEAQDTSPIQMEIIDALTRDNQNLTLVGDVDQSMYAFRGAVPEVLRRDGFDRFVLPINYRSTKAIIEAGRNIIENNYHYEPELMKAFQARPKAPHGESPQAILSETFEELAHKIADLLTEDGEFGNWYILNRTRAECAAVHTALISRGIPAINKSGGLLFGAPHIRKVLAYARLACNYENARDDLDILGEIANVASSSFVSPINRRRHLESCDEDRFWIDCGCPLVLEKGKSHTTARYYGVKSLQKAGDWAGIKRQQYEKNKGGFPTMAAYGARDLVEFVELISMAGENSAMCLDTIIEESVLPWLMEQEGISNEDLAENGKVEDFQLLLEMAEPEMNIEEFLIAVDEITQADTAEDDGTAAIIGTFHWAKGAEREKVIVNLTRCPIIPPVPRENELPMGQPPLLEEERRLAFVGVTRAKDEAYIFASREWLGNGLPTSQFIGELTGCN
jgi:DNA helicase-2/ATP-dependent DNA helicase PcrA